MTDQRPTTKEPTFSRLEPLGARLREFPEEELELIARSGAESPAEFDNGFDNAFDNAFDNS